MSAQRLRRTPLLALVLALLLTGCGGTDKPDAVPGKDPGTVKSSAKPVKKDPPPDPGFGAPKLGQCYLIFAKQSRASVASGRRVGCNKRHTTVVAYVGFRPRAVTPKTPVANRRRLGNRVCAPAYRKAVGGTLADRATSILTWTLYTPNQAQLKRGARWVRCDVLARGGDKLIPLPSSLPLLGGGVPEQLRICQTEAGVDISCSVTHAFRVEAVYQAVGDAYPDATTYTPLARQRCKELTNKDGGFWQPPSKQGWSSGDRFIRCLTAQS
jgi:hypothetical protein